MKNKYQFAHNKPDEKRRKLDRRKKTSIEDAAANFLQEIIQINIYYGSEPK